MNDEVRALVDRLRRDAEIVKKRRDLAFAARKERLADALERLVDEADAAASFRKRAEAAEEDWQKAEEKIRSLRKQIEQFGELIPRLRTFLAHDGECPFLLPFLTAEGPNACTCGLAELSDEVDALEAALSEKQEARP